MTSMSPMVPNIHASLTFLIRQRGLDIILSNAGYAVPRFYARRLAEHDAADEAGRCPECEKPYAAGDGSAPYCCDCAEPVSSDEADASPAVLRAMLHLARMDASLAQAELTELREIAPAHRAVVPIATVSRIANCIVERVLTMTDWKRSQYKQLHAIIMEEFDRELG